MHHPCRHRPPDGRAGDSWTMRTPSPIPSPGRRGRGAARAIPAPAPPRLRRLHREPLPAMRGEFLPSANRTSAAIRPRRPPTAPGLRLWWFLAALLLALGCAVLPASANPNSAGTLCSRKQLDQMTAPHGPVTEGSGPYTLSAAAIEDEPGVYKVILEAASPFKGLLLYAADRVDYAGIFSNYGDKLKVKQDCGTNEDAILEHNSPEEKAGRFELRWKAFARVPEDGVEINVIAIVLTSKLQWYELPMASFTYRRPDGIEAANPTTRTLPPVVTTEPVAATTVAEATESLTPTLDTTLAAVTTTPVLVVTTTVAIVPPTTVPAAPTTTVVAVLPTTTVAQARPTTTAPAPTTTLRPTTTSPPEPTATMDPENRLPPELQPLGELSQIAVRLGPLAPEPRMDEDPWQEWEPVPLAMAPTTSRRRARTTRPAFGSAGGAALGGMGARIGGKRVRRGAGQRAAAKDW